MVLLLCGGDKRTQPRDNWHQNPFAVVHLNFAPYEVYVLILADFDGRFPFFVTCKSCSFKSDNVRTAGLAVE